jgi:hypothetical protein
MIPTCGTLTAVSRVEVLLKDWYDLDHKSWAEDGCRPVSFFSVIQARKMYRGEFPKPARTTPPNTNYYYLSDLRAWKKTHPGLFKGTKPKAG